MTADVQNHTHVPVQALNEHVRGFLHSLQSRRPETRGTYKRTLSEFLRWYPGDFRFTPPHVEHYKHHLVFGKHLATVSVSAYLTSFRQLCEYLVGQGILTLNPARDIGGGKRPSEHSRGVLSVDEVERLFASIPREDELGARDYAIAKLMVECGLTEIELIRADASDFRVEDGVPSLYVRGKGKDVSEAVTLTMGVNESLVKYLLFRHSAKPGDPLFRSAGNRTRGMRMTTRGIRSRVSFYLDRSDIKRDMIRRITPHSLRHTAAVLMADAGATPDEIRQRLRLGTVATAMLYVNHKSRSHSISPSHHPPSATPNLKSNVDNTKSEIA